MYQLIEYIFLLLKEIVWFQQQAVVAGLYKKWLLIVPKDIII